METQSARFEAAADALARDGWCVVERLLPDAATDALARECAGMHKARRMTPARVGESIGEDADPEQDVAPNLGGEEQMQDA